jgi:OHCU decarboxylase
MITLEQLNGATEREFVAALDGVFEHSPWIAARAASARPFHSRLQLLDTLRAVINDATAEAQLALIRAHPELAGRAAVRNELTPESGREQHGAGLHACTPQEFARLQQLNAVYRDRFGFPFILAVRGHDPASIIGAFEQRLLNDADRERLTALHEIGCIGGYRLAERVTGPMGAEIMALIDRLAQFSEQPDALTCSYLSAAHRATAAQIREWMLSAGLSVEIDAVGNIVGRLRGSVAGAGTLMTGSHFDTVVDAGRYDGRLGIVLPIVVVQQLRQRGVQLPFDLEIVAFADEEGVRFKSTFLGSSAVAGCFDDALLERSDGSGNTLRSALLEAGFDPDAIPRITRDPRRLLGYVEVHIEQGPVLLNEQQPLGVVTAIAGSVRYGITVIGRAGHAGTVPMACRHDALAAAAEIVLGVEHCASQTPAVVGTVGLLEVPAGAINVIPGRCELTLDLRAPENSTRDAAVRNVLTMAGQIAARREVQIQVQQLMSAEAAPCAAWLQSQWAASITRVTGEAAPRRLASGAGHDAMKLAAITSVGMLFVRCGNGGISHHPDESMTAADAQTAALVFEDFLINFREDA